MLYPEPAAEPDRKDHTASVDSLLELKRRGILTTLEALLLQATQMSEGMSGFD